MTSEEIIRILQEVEHPGNGDRDIVDLGMVESVQADGNKVTVNLAFPKHRDPLSEYLVGSCKATIIRHFPQAEVEVKTSVKEAAPKKKPGLDLGFEELKNVRHLMWQSIWPLPSPGKGTGWVLRTLTYTDLPFRK